MRKNIILSALLISLLSGCTRLSIASDLKGLARQNGIAISPHSCKSLNGSRTYTCLAPITSSDAIKLSQSLNMAEITQGKMLSLDDLNSHMDDAKYKTLKDDKNIWEYMYWSKDIDKTGCESNASFQDASHVSIFKSQRRDPKIQLSNGAGFEYMLLYFNPSRSEACIQVSYAYG